MSAAAKTKEYDVVPTDIRRMTKLHTPAGDIKFTSLMKLIYAYIWTFQGNEDRGNDDPIHTNTNVIAWEMGVSEKSVIDALKALDAAGVVIKRTFKVRGNVNSSNYVAIPPASVVALGITPPKPGNGKVSNPAAAPATTSAQPTSATILDLIDEILKSDEYDRDSDTIFEVVKSILGDEIKKSSHYDDPMKYKRKKEIERGWTRFDIQVQQVIGRLAEMALEQRGLDAPVKTAIADYLRYYQEEQEFLNEQKNAEATEEPQSAPAAAPPTDQNIDLAPEPAQDAPEQQSGVESNDDNGGNDGAGDHHEVSQVEGQQEDHFPWKGDTFIKNRLSENAYQWALTAGATDWRHACCLVWEKVEVTPPTEIDEHFKPLSLC